ncbi:MAG: response regulator transcription factor [Bacteroidota bacterium]
MDSKIKVAVFDDNRSRRNSLDILIGQSANMICVGTFEDCSDVINDINSSSPDVVLMDIDMPIVNGIEGARLIRSHYPELCIIMQTVFEDDDKIIDAIAAGANGYILKKTHPSKIIEAISDVINGGAPITSSVARRLLELFQQGPARRIDNDYKLTDREKEILTDLVKGLSYKMIAEHRSISVFTVNSHMRKIYDKLQVHSVAEAVRKAIEQRII